MRTKGSSAVIFVLTVLFVSVLSPGVHAELKVWSINPAKLTTGKLHTVDLDSLVYNTAPQSRLQVKVSPSASPDLKATYDDRENAIHITIDKNRTGVRTVDFVISNSQGESRPVTLLLWATKDTGHTFRFRPGQPVQRVFVAGDFNGWNQHATQLLDKDGDGTYEVNVDLEPGKYQYKFVVDGRWLADPQNPDKSPDGFGGYNSVLSYFPPKKPELVGVNRVVGEVLEYDIQFVPGAGAFQIDQNSVVVLLNNERLGADCVKVDQKANMLRIKMDTVPSGWCVFQIGAQDKKGIPAEPIVFEEFLGDAAPYDWRDTVLYFLFIDRFHNGDKKNDRPLKDRAIAKSANYEGGDFAGIIKKIEDGYFQKLGINAIWITPVYENPNIVYTESVPPQRKFTGYHGYWPISPTNVEEHFGDNEQLKEMVELAHASGIRVLLDLVTNHVHEDHPWFREHPEWFGPLNLPDGRLNIRLFDEHPLTTWFDTFLPSFDFAGNAGAQKAMVENAVWWIKETDADGFRLDAVKHVPHSLWLEMRQAIRREVEFPQGKRFYTVGESISSPAKIMEYVSEYELDGQFDFPLFWVIRDVFGTRSRNCTALAEALEMREKSYPATAIMGVFIGNHDFPRFAAYADGDITSDGKVLQAVPQIDDQSTYDRIKLAFTLIMSIRGVPTIYYGDEIGLSGAGDPDNRRMMKFGEQVTEQEREFSEYLARLISIRKELPSLRYGITRVLDVTPATIAFASCYFQDFALVCMNVSDVSEDRKIEIPDGLGSPELLKDKISGTLVQPTENGEIVLTLAPRSAAILVPVK